MKWPHPIKAYGQSRDMIGLLATLTILALGLSLVAIIFAVGKEDNAAN